MHIINIEEDRIGLRFGVTGENRLVLLAVTEGKNRRHPSAIKEAVFGGDNHGRELSGRPDGEPAHPYLSCGEAAV